VSNINIFHIIVEPHSRTYFSHYLRVNLFSLFSILQQISLCLGPNIFLKIFCAFLFFDETVEIDRKGAERRADMQERVEPVGSQTGNSADKSICAHVVRALTTQSPGLYPALSLPKYLTLVLLYWNQEGYAWTGHFAWKHHWVQERLVCLPQAGCNTDCKMVLQCQTLTLLTSSTLFLSFKM